MIAVEEEELGEGVGLFFRQFGWLPCLLLKDISLSQTEQVVKFHREKNLLHVKLSEIPKDPVLLYSKLQRALFKLRTEMDEKPPTDLELLDEKKFSDLVENLAKGLYPDEEVYRQAEDLIRKELEEEEEEKEDKMSEDAEDQ